MTRADQERLALLTTYATDAYAISPRFAHPELAGLVREDVANPDDPLQASLLSGGIPSETARFRLRAVGGATSGFERIMTTSRSDRDVPSAGRGRQKVTLAV